MTSQRLESEGSNPSGPIADNGGTTARLPEQAKVVQEPARADLTAGHTRLRPADACVRLIRAHFLLEQEEQWETLEAQMET